MPKFRLVDRYRYWWPVKVVLPDPANPGHVVEHELEVEFEPVSRDEATQMDAEYRALTSPEEIVQAEHKLLVRVVKNWRGVLGDNDAEVSFNDDAFRAALQWPWFRKGCYRAYGESLSGDEARLGN